MEDIHMDELVKIIRRSVVPNFINIRTSIRTYDRNAIICGAFM